MKIPQGAKRVFQGVIFDVYQWPQKMFDGSLATFEAFKRADSSAVITVVGDKILIQKQEQPDSKKSYVSLPGGRNDENEDPLDGAKRELLEETGYVSEDWELLYTREPFYKAEWTMYYYVARKCQYQQEPKLDGGEKITNTLISLEEFIILSENPDFYEPDFTNFLLRLRLDPKKLEEFKNLLFK